MGFELYSFERCVPSALPIGFKGLGQPLYAEAAEAVYTKKLSELLPCKDKNKLYKWAFFSSIYKKVALCLKALKVLAPSSSFEDLLRKYGLNKVAEEVKKRRKVESNCFLELINPLS